MIRHHLVGLLAIEWWPSLVGALLIAAGIHGGGAWLVLATFGAMLLTGNAVHLVHLVRADRRYPAPGKHVEVDGARVHVLAEGDARDCLPIVIFGGSHSAGAAMAHLHRVLRDETRSILIDRPGTGWSSTGRFPRTTAREAEEMMQALDAAGEQGPFVLAGYSFGGLLAANIARRYPERVARLILLDATPPETVIIGPRFGAIRTMLRDNLVGGLLRLIGIDIDFEERLARRELGERADNFKRVLGEDYIRMKQVEVRAGVRLAAWSIYHELVPDHLARVAWDTTVYDGDLEGMDVWLVAPGDATEVTTSDVFAGQQDREAARMLNFFARTRERYMATSSRSRRIATPPGTTHGFVYERPDFVVDVLRKAVRP